MAGGGGNKKKTQQNQNPHVLTRQLQAGVELLEAQKELWKRALKIVSWGRMEITKQLESIQ